MARVTENDILSQEEFDEYRAKTSRYRFANQLLLGVGGATVFGLVGAVGHSLMGGLLSGAIAQSSFTLLGLSATPLAIGGLALLAAIGVGCVYMGSRFLTRNIILDQDFQAKKIGAAARSRARDVEMVAPIPSAPTVLPTGQNAAAQLERQAQVSVEMPRTDPADAWSQRVGARPAPVAEQRAQPERWADRASAEPEATQALRS